MKLDKPKPKKDGQRVFHYVKDDTQEIVWEDYSGDKVVDDVVTELPSETKSKKPKKVKVTFSRPMMAPAPSTLKKKKTTVKKPVPTTKKAVPTTKKTTAKRKVSKK